MFSVVVPTYQRVDCLERCLAALGRHRPAECEIVVVDDASPSRDIETLCRQFSFVQYLRQSRRGGFAQAANAGIRATTGDIVQLLNDDAEVQPAWAAPALSWFNDPSIGAVAPLVGIWPCGERIDSAGDRYYVGGVAAKRLHRQAATATPAGDFVFGASASSAFYRRSALDRVGLFPENFGSYFEDVDLAFRLQRAGYRARFEPASQVLHRVSASFGNTGRQLLERQSTNEERVFWRNLPGRTLWSTLPRHIAVLAGKAWRRWNDGTLTPFLLGRLRVLTEVADIGRHRRALRAIGPDVDVRRWSVETQYWGG